MAIKSRADLRSYFTKGRRPKQQEFWDWQDSFYHKTEDPVNVGGWQFRSFFKDLRAEGLAITTGGMISLEIPYGVTKLMGIRLMGKATPTLPPAPFTITTTLALFSDKNIAGLNGIASGGNPYPSGLFGHLLVGTGSVPLANLIITTAGPQFNGSLDFITIPKKVPLMHAQFRMLQLRIAITGGSFPNTAGDPSYLYYGLEYE